MTKHYKLGKAQRFFYYYGREVLIVDISTAGNRYQNWTTKAKADECYADMIKGNVRRGFKGWEEVRAAA